MTDIADFFLGLKSKYDQDEVGAFYLFGYFMNHLGHREICRPGFPLLHHYFYEIDNWIVKNIPKVGLNIE